MFAAQLQDEGAVGAGAGVGGAGFEARFIGLFGFGAVAGAAAGGFGDFEWGFGGRVGGRGGRPWLEVGGGEVAPTGGRGGEGGAGAGLEVEAEVFEGLLGGLLEARLEPAGGGDRGGAGELDDDAGLGVVDFDEEVDQPACFGIASRAGGTAGGAEVDLAGQGVGEDRGLDFDLADLGGGGAVAGVVALHVDLGRRAAGEAVGLGGIDGEAGGEGDGGVLEGRGGGVFEPFFLGDVEVEFKPRGGVGLGGGRLGGDRRFEAELIAAADRGRGGGSALPAGVGEVGLAVGEQMAGVLPGVDVDMRGEARRGAVGGVGGEGDFGFGAGVDRGGVAEEGQRDALDREDVGLQGGDADMGAGAGADEGRVEQRRALQRGQEDGELGGVAGLGGDVEDRQFSFDCFGFEEDEGADPAGGRALGQRLGDVGDVGERAGGGGEGVADQAGGKVGDDVLDVLDRVLLIHTSYSIKPAVVEGAGGGEGEGGGEGAGMPGGLGIGSAGRAELGEGEIERGEGRGRGGFGRGGDRGRGEDFRGGGFTAADRNFVDRAGAGGDGGRDRDGNPDLGQRGEGRDLAFGSAGDDLAGGDFFGFTFPKEFRSSCAQRQAGGGDAFGQGVGDGDGAVGGAGADVGEDHDVAVTGVVLGRKWGQRFAYFLVDGVVGGGEAARQDQRLQRPGGSGGSGRGRPHRTEHQYGGGGHGASQRPRSAQ